MVIGGGSGSGTTEDVLDSSGIATATTKAAVSVTPSVHLVIQRYRQCKLLLEEREWITVGTSQSLDANDNKEQQQEQQQPQHQQHCGLLVYVSFAAHTNQSVIERSAQIIMNLPILTLGLWGDGTDSQTSLVQLIHQQLQQAQQQQQAQDSSTGATNIPICSIIICPQANLISKIKSNGKSIQYHNQINKNKGQECYQYFCDILRAHILEQQQTSLLSTSSSLPPSYIRWKRKHPLATSTISSSTSVQTAIAVSSTAMIMMLDPSIPPAKMYTSDVRYTSWDDNGIPLVLSETGQELTKSARKKLVKQQQTHTKRHEKWLLSLQQNQQNEQSSDTTTASTATPAAAAAAPGSSSSSTEVEPTEDDADDESWKLLPLAGCCFATVTSRHDNNNVHDDHQQQSSQSSSTTSNSGAAVTTSGAVACQLIQGSFGMRQGLELYSDMGPFCHVLQI